MKLRSVFIAVALLSVLTFIAYKVTEPEGKKTDSSEQKLLEPALFEQVAQIQFKNQEDPDFIKFKKKKTKIWVLENFYSVPADLQKLSSLINQWLDATIIRSVTQNPERIERLNIGKQSIRLLGEAEQPLWELETGKGGPSGGTFVRLNQKPEVVLADLDLYLNTEKQDWADKTVLDFNPESIAQASIAFTEEATPLILIRDTQGAPFSSAELGEGKTIKQTEVTRFLNSLINAPIAEVKDAADPTATEVKAHVKAFSFKLFNGEQYTLDIGRNPVFHSHAEASTPHSHGETQTPDSHAAKETEAESEPVFIFYTLPAAANSPWQASLPNVALTFPHALYDQLPKTRQVFIETIEEPESEGAVLEGEQGQGSLDTEPQAG